MTTILIAGAVFLLIGLVGGGLKIRELSVPQISGFSRTVSFSLGIIFCGIYILSETESLLIWRENESDSNDEEVPIAKVLLPAPKIVEPENNVLIDWPENGSLIFKWTTVPEAATYAIEYDCRDRKAGPASWKGTDENPWKLVAEVEWRMSPNPTVESNIVEEVHGAGANAVRARVWAIGHDGESGEKSKWCQIRFPVNRTGPVNSNIERPDLSEEFESQRGVDLSFVGWTFEPKVPIQGRPVKVNVSVENLGRTKAGPFQVVWWPGVNFREPGKTWHVRGLSPGEKEDLTFIYPGYSTWYANLETKVVIDPLAIVPESNLQNNIWQRRVSISEK